MKVDYIALSVPIFFILIGIELIYAYLKKLNLYRLNDSISNLSQGIGQQLTGILMKTALFFGYLWIYEHLRLWDVPSTWWTWLILFVSVDFFYYWFHRLSHEINFLWAAHVVHHQSEEYNLTVALRQSWFQGWFSWVFYLPLALVGFEPVMFLTMSAFNTLYQFWIHTQAIKHMGWLEYIINTPSHHRVHHGSNPKYIDKNHAGTLIVWDRLFGTFQREEEEVVYGITKPLASWNPIRANFQNWIDLFDQAKGTPGILNKIKVFTMPPGWTYDRGIIPVDEPSLRGFQKYDAANRKIRIIFYTLVHFTVTLLCATYILNNYSQLTTLQMTGGIILVLFGLITCGAMFERHRWLIAFEIVRLSVSALFLIYYFLQSDSDSRLLYILPLIFIFSLVWFMIIKKDLNETG